MEITLNYNEAVWLMEAIETRASILMNAARKGDKIAENQLKSYPNEITKDIGKYIQLIENDDKFYEQLSLNLDEEV